MDALLGNALSAALTVKDLGRSLAWYRDVMGFTVEREHAREGKLAAVSLKAGVVAILLSQDTGVKGVDRLKGEGFSLRITTTQDVDAIAARIKAQGGTLESEPFDAFGARAFRLRDPDGFRLVISSEAPTRTS